MGFCFGLFGVFFPPEISLPLPVKELGSSVPGCSFPNFHTASHLKHKLFCSHMRSCFEDLVWLESTCFFTPSVSCQLLPFPAPAYHLVMQALGGPGASFFPWHNQWRLLQELTELQSRRRDQYLQVADQSTSAPSLGPSIKLFVVRRWESGVFAPESTPRSPGEKKSSRAHTEQGRLWGNTSGTSP